MENLFIDNPETQEKLAGATIALPNDPTVWKKIIITEFLTDNPTLQNDLITISWKKQDMSKGYAVGTLKVIGGVVPLTVKDFRLDPMDVIMFGNRAIPLTAETLAELQASPSPFKGTALSRPKDSLDMFGGGQVQWSPVDNEGTYSHNGDSTSFTRDAVKVGSFIDRIEHIDKQDVKDLLAPISEDPTLFVSFQKNGTSSVIEKLASRTLLSKETILEAFLRNVEIDRQYIYEDDQGNSFLKQANSNINYTWEVPISSEEASTIVIEYPPVDTKEVDTIKEVTKIAETLEPGMVGKFVTGEGEIETPEVNIVSVNPMKVLQKFAYLNYTPNEKQLFVIDENNNYTIIDNTTDRSLEKVASKVDIVTTEPKLGSYGVWVEGDKVLTKPFSVTAIQKLAEANGHFIRTSSGLNGQVSYYITKMAFEGLSNKVDNGSEQYVGKDVKFLELGKSLGSNNVLQNELIEIAKYAHVSPSFSAIIEATVGFEKVSYYVSPDVDQITQLTIEKRPELSVYIIPPKAQFISTVESEKTANHQIREYSNYVGKDTGGWYYMNGFVLDKYASDRRNMTLEEVTWAAIHCGASGEDVTKIAALIPGETYTITNRLKLPVDVKKFEKAAADRYEELSKSGKGIIAYLLKEASVLKGVQTVDAVLSLGLLKKHNIMEYLPFIEDYERIMSELAKLLVMVRLGLVQIPEEPLETTLTALNQVIFALKRVKSTLSKVK